MKGELPIVSAFMNGHVLLVEDNLVNQDVAQELLSELGLTCEIANNGTEAIACLKNKTSSKEFAAVLMDCQMPKMDGFEASKAIRAGKAGPLWESIPIIAITANAMVGDKERCLAAGMNDYIAKPIDSSVLKNRLYHWVKGQADVNTAAITAKKKPVAIYQWLGVEALELLDVAKIPPALNKRPERYLKLLTVFIEDNENTVRKIKAASEQSNTQALKRILHTLKGATANLGVMGIYKVCNEAEQALIQHQLLNKDQVAQLEESITAMCDELSQFVQSNHHLVTG